MPISEKQADDLFKLCDTNGDGIVTKLELLKGLNAYFQKTMSVEDVSNIFNGLDEDGDNKITKDEFRNQLCQKLDRRETFAKVFDDMDTNKDGTLSRDEIRVVCQKSGYNDAEIDNMIKACDTDGDGKLSKREFMALV